LLVGYLVSLIAVARGMLPGRRGGKGGKRSVIWHKTHRYGAQTRVNAINAANAAAAARAAASAPASG
jgi:hypothetical protein